MAALLPALNTFAQAPSISYATPQSYTVGSAIATLSPTVVGSVPTTPTYTVTTFAGNASAGLVNATGTAAKFSQPRGIAVDASGNFYIADMNNHVIRKITSAGVITTFAGTGASGSTDATGTAASFNQPQDITIDPSGNLYVADYGNSKIRKITSAGVVTTLATVTNPAGILYSSTTGSLFASSYSTHTIVQITFAGATSVFAGTSGTIGSTNATGTAASFFNPVGISDDGTGNIYVADQGNNLVRKITAAGVVTTLAGSGAVGSADGTGTAATFSYPSGLSINNGIIYVGDTQNNKIRMITAAGVVTTIAGSGTAGLTDGNGTAASFNGPYGIQFDASGNFLIADTYNNEIRKVVPGGGYKISGALPAGLSFNTTNGQITGTPTAVTASTNYTITAYNLSGAGSTTLNITVSSASPSLTNPVDNDPAGNYVAANAPANTTVGITAQSIASGYTGVNIALNKNTFESGHETTIFLVSYPSSLAVDGNTGTRFSSNFADNAWITVDLGATYNISGVKLLWEAAYGKSYKIQTSADNTSWTDIYSTTTGDGNTDDLTGGLATGTGRYVRMQGVLRGFPTAGYSMYEFQIYGTPVISYSLTTNPSSIFQINSATGVISVLSGTSLNAGAYTVGVTAAAGGLTAATNFTVNAVGAPTVPAVARCGAGAITVTASATPTGGTYNWYTAATGGTLLQSSTSTTYTPTLVTNATYYVSYTLGGITSARTAVTATINPVVSSPISNSTFSYSFTGNTKDVSGKQNDGIPTNAPTAVADRYGVATTAYSFNGTNQWVETSTQVTDPQTFSISAWFKTTTTSGGKIVGFTNSQDGGGQYDRHLYMTNGGLLYFGVYVNGFNTVNTTTAYNDGFWHHAVVTLSATNGMKLYVDNTLQASNAAFTSAEPHNGYWGIGGAIANNIGGWPSSPTSTYFNGTIDDVAVYSTELSAATVTSSNDINQIGAYAPVCVGSPITIYTPTIIGATYTWTDPSGATQTGQNPTFASAIAGNYTLAVTGGPGGCSSTATITPTVNALPSAAFTATTYVDINSNATITLGTYVASSTYTWTFTGGTPATGTGAGPFSVQWATTGAKTVSLSVTSSSGCTATSSQTVNVNNTTYGNYAFRRSVTLNTTSASITTNLSNFPALLSIQSNDLIITGTCGDKVFIPNGPNYDFAFVDPSSATELYYQVESYNQTTGTLLVWVRLPSVNYAANNVISFYYGSLAPTVTHNTAFFQNTWTSDYQAVYHFNEAAYSGTTQDGTGNGRTATLVGFQASDFTTGKIGSAYTFGGTAGSPTANDMEAVNSPVSGAFTLSAWVKSSNTVLDEKIITNQDASGYLSGGYKLGIFFTIPETEGVTKLNRPNTPNPTALSNNVWYYLQGVYDGATMSTYVNGVQYKQLAVTGNIPSASTLYIGIGEGKQFPFSGIIDEPRVSNVAKTTDWLKMEYVDQNDPVAFTSVNATRITNVTNAAVLPGALTYTWKGVNTNETNPNNWDNTTAGTTNQLPAFTGNATLVIPAGLANYPSLTADESIYGLTIASGATLNLNGKVLSVGCNIYNSSGGQILYNGNNASGIAWNGSSANQTYTGSNALNTAQVGTMTINNAAGSTITLSGGPIDIYNSLTMTKGNLVVSASPAVLTLKSTSSQSAYVSQVPSAYTISGNVNVERFITGGSTTYRGYRLLSSPVNISSSTTGGGNIGLSYINTTPTVPAGSTVYGALTGGPGGATNGFTVGNANPTIYIYNEGRKSDRFTFTSGKTIGIYKINATDVTTLTSYVQTPGVTIPVGNGVMFYFIGNNQSTTVTGTRVPENTTITAIGYLNQGTIPVKIWNTGSTNLSYASAVNPGYNLLGNPYASTIDLNVVYTDNGSLYPNFYELNNQNPSQNYVNYNAPTGATSGTPRASRYIASGQGFFVKATGASQTFNFKEDQKVSTQLSSTGANNFILLQDAPKSAQIVNGENSNINSSFNTIASPAPQTTPTLTGLHVQLFKDSLANDECGIYFRNDWDDKLDDNDAKDLDGMAPKVFMSSFTADGERTAINFLSDYKVGKKVKLFVKSSADGMYSLNITDILNIDTSLYKITLLDHFKKDSLDIGRYKTYNFNITNADTLSFGPDRFELAISQLFVPKYQLATFTAQKAAEGVLVTWRTLNEGNKYAFTLEKQDAGSTGFSPVYQTQNNGGTIYKYTDITPFTGNNVYRLKQVDLFGNITYAGPVSVYYDKSGNSSLFSLYPNPTVETINVNVTYGKPNKNAPLSYKLKIYDITGSVVMQKTSDNSSFSQNVSKFNPGVYIVELRDNNGSSLGKAKFVKK